MEKAARRNITRWRKGEIEIDAVGGPARVAFQANIVGAVLEVDFGTDFERELFHDKVGLGELEIGRFVQAGPGEVAGQLAFFPFDGAEVKLFSIVLEIAVEQLRARALGLEIFEARLEGAKSGGDRWRLVGGGAFLGNHFPAVDAQENGRVGQVWIFERLFPNPRTQRRDRENVDPEAGLFEIDVLELKEVFSGPGDFADSDAARSQSGPRHGGNPRAPGEGEHDEESACDCQTPSQAPLPRSLAHGILYALTAVVSGLAKRYCGRIAPSPTGYLHLGHARTFWTAQERARAAGGKLILRVEDLDRARCRPEFVKASIEDLEWFGFRWDEGPIFQSERTAQYREALESLRRKGAIYQCVCSRQDVLRALSAPHLGEEEPVYAGTCRGKRFTEEELRGRQVNWRFRVPDGWTLTFEDGRLGQEAFVAGKDFGDFVVWRHDDVPSYQLAVVVDDAAMEISEVVRGEDLLMSTARQLLIYDALGLSAPGFYHCPLMLDQRGERLAKRSESLSLRQLRAAGKTPEELRSRWSA